MHAAADRGLHMPDDLSVIGITDIQLARESRPALTTVAVPTVKVAQLAVALLRELIETSYGQAASAASVPMRISSAPKLVVRIDWNAPVRVDVANRLRRRYVAKPGNATAIARPLVQQSPWPQAWARP